jgi:hypothetical protein
MDKIIFLFAFFSSGLIVAMQWILEKFLTEPPIKLLTFFVIVLLFLTAGFGLKRYLVYRQYLKDKEWENGISGLRHDVENLKSVIPHK